MKKIITGLILVTCALIHCKPTYNDINPDIKWIDNYKDPYLSGVHDSLKHLIPILDSILRSDQKYRSISDPKIFERNQKKQARIDVANLKSITTILDKYGWLGQRDIGFIGAKAISMVMIHSDAQTKLKYYPMLINAARNGKVSFESVALYEDKLNAMLRRQQYYGSQVIQHDGKSVLYPVFLVNELELRRKMIGVLPINNYLKMFPNPDSGLKVYHDNYEKIASSVKLTDSSPIHFDLKYIIDSLKIKK